MPAVWLFGNRFLFPENQNQVAEVNYQTQALAKNKNRIHPVNGVEQQAKPPGNAENPETQRDHAFALPFWSNPLDKKSHKKQELGEETENDPEIQMHFPDFLK